ncbi:hypothetical protein [Halorhodospira halochloris]|uniref:hypothetical protein n=1 Tax=Halorhodospira halochloris TaxID=1052 RepID=UPI001EE969C6|nr:hypothetical protein [Halorhodospira halochloris]MCG5549289.1 hypothetical protein [Halorhodospira halochloris]
MKFRAMDVEKRSRITNCASFLDQPLDKQDLTEGELSLMMSDHRQDYEISMVTHHLGQKCMI